MRHSCTQRCNQYLPLAGRGRRRTVGVDEQLGPADPATAVVLSFSKHGGAVNRKNELLYRIQACSCTTTSGIHTYKVLSYMGIERTVL